MLLSADARSLGGVFLSANSHTHDNANCSRQDDDASCDPRIVRRHSRDLLMRAHEVKQCGAQATAREHDRRAKRKQRDKVEGQIIRRARYGENAEHDHGQTRERLNACRAKGHLACENFAAASANLISAPQRLLG